MADVQISLESELDREIEAILGLMVKGLDTAEVQTRFQELTRKRASLMRSPSRLGRLQRRQKMQLVTQKSY